uniref:Beta-1,4-N-acetylgalactosaminyltransferase n=1 Tax=Esox lucius TaxID=8010 RepID=A0A6Q2XDU4_ESOLU
HMDFKLWKINLCLCVSAGFRLASESKPGKRPAQERVVRMGEKTERDGMEWFMRSSFHCHGPSSSLCLQYKGKANLHVFEDWCGSSTAQLRQNLHYPLYPHSRTTVKKLAVSPRWTNYGLRIFGYLHPYTNGEFVFAVSSDDNSEFWLSWDESPLNLQLLAWIGKTGMEWTAPGEFEKYASQTSRPVRLLVQRKYFFEIVHKQNDRGTDHVEVAWQLNQEGQRFTVIGSKYISLYANESSLRMDDVIHIPQTIASHTLLPSNQPDEQPVADMLRDDPRDTLYQVPPLESKYLEGVLPDCSYKPSYVIKGFPLLRYQGLQFIHMSYIYPNDYTRLTHMETHNTCFYHDTVVQTKPKELDPGPWSQRHLNNTSTEQLRSATRPAEQHRPTKMERSRAGEHKQGWKSVDKLVLRPAAPEQTRDRQAKQNSADSNILPALQKSKQNIDKDIPEHPLIRQGRAAARDKPAETRKRGQDLEADILFQAHTQMKGEGDEREWEREGEGKSLWGLGRDSEEEQAYDSTFPPVFDPEVNWAQTFQLTPVNLQAMRSDWIDLRCNVSGNLMLRASDALPVVKAFMDKLNTKHHGRFSLVRVLNIERRVDGAQGSRYFLELELRDINGQHLRLSKYIYALIRHNRSRGLQPLIHEKLLCNPVGFQWNPTATVHFIVPVKNQARWVQQLIVDMEGLYHSTGDPNFNLIITDYNSTDMDIETALKASKLHRFQYLKLSGNFERSAGLQAGIDLITDEHSIVFLCDLHIHFPPSIIDSVRKHCVEGYMAFAPVVMRLDCGATPRDPRGYWEVNGFGLLGIYKSDLEAAGGMNTQDFTDRWGGEDWELLDRVLQSGLEVERIYLRNFLHRYHSKRGMWNRRTQHSGT